MGEKIEALRDSKLRENRRTERKFLILGGTRSCERKVKVWRENSGNERLVDGRESRRTERDFMFWRDLKF